MSLALKLLVTIAALSLPAQASAQASGRIRIALNVTEPPRAPFYSSFATALRALGDIDVVTDSEDSDLRLRIAVVCSTPTTGGGECDGVSPYRLAVSLASPVARELVRHVIADTMMQAYFRSFERFQGMWVAVWGTSRYEQETRSLVADIDSACFERIRILRRASSLYNAGQQAQASALFEEVERGKMAKYTCGI